MITAITLAVGLASLLAPSRADAAADPRRHASGLELLWHVPGGSPFHRLVVVDGELIWIDAYTLDRRVLATGERLGEIAVGREKECISSLAALWAIGDALVGAPCSGDPANPGGRSADTSRLVAYDPRRGGFRWSADMTALAQSQILDASPGGLLLHTYRRPPGRVLSGFLRVDLPARIERWRQDLDGLIPWGGLSRDQGRIFALLGVDGRGGDAVVAVDEASGAILWRLPIPGAESIAAVDGQLLVHEPAARAIVVVDAASGAVIQRHVLKDLCPWTCLEVHGGLLYTLECGPRHAEHFGRLVVREVATGERRWSFPGVVWEGGPELVADDLALVPRDPGLSLPVDPRTGARLWRGVPFGEHTLSATVEGRQVLITWFDGHLVAYRPRAAPAPAERALVRGVATIDGLPREGLVIRVGRFTTTSGPRGRFAIQVPIDAVLRVEIDERSARAVLAPRLGADMVLFRDPAYVFRDGSRRYRVDLEASGVTHAEWLSG